MSVLAATVGVVHEFASLQKQVEGNTKAIQSVDTHINARLNDMNARINDVTGRLDSQQNTLNCILAAVLKNK